MRGGSSWQLIFMIFIQCKYIEIQTEVNSLDNDLAVHLLVVQTWVTFRPPELNVGIYLPGKNWSRKYLCNWISKPVLACKDKKGKYFLFLCWSPQKVGDSIQKII